VFIFVSLSFSFPAAQNFPTSFSFSLFFFSLSLCFPLVVLWFTKPGGTRAMRYLSLSLSLVLSFSLDAQRVCAYRAAKREQKFVAFLSCWGKREKTIRLSLGLQSLGFSLGFNSF
jgi:hypothetical protein